MGFLLVVLSFVVAEEVVELEPAGVEISGSHKCNVLSQTNCQNDIRCYWLGGSDGCTKDECWKVITPDGDLGCTSPPGGQPSGCAVGTLTSGFDCSLNTSTVKYCHLGAKTVSTTALNGINYCAYIYEKTKKCPSGTCHVSDSLGGDAKYCSPGPSNTYSTFEAAWTAAGSPNLGSSSSPSSAGDIDGFNKQCGALGEDFCTQNPLCYVDSHVCKFDQCAKITGTPECGSGCAPVGFYNLPGEDEKSICLRSKVPDTINKCFYLARYSGLTPAINYSVTKPSLSNQLPLANLATFCSNNVLADCSANTKCVVGINQNGPYIGKYCDIVGGANLSRSVVMGVPSFIVFLVFAIMASIFAS